MDASRLDLLLLHPGGLPIGGTDPVDLSLGGSETAVVSMARSLSRLGHRVTVYCKAGEPHHCGGVEYLPADRLTEERAGRDCDLLLAARFFQVLELPVAARMYGLWFHDMPQVGAIPALHPALARAAFCFFLSRFHRESFAAHYPGLGSQALLTRNGIDFTALGEIRDASREQSPHPRFLYASRPERGLAVLLQEIWPALKRRLPEAELLVTTYSLQGLPDPPPQVRRHQQLCDELLRSSPGVHRIGPLTRRQFWRELAAATAVLYPTDFPEVSCMVALEAQAMGTPIVTTGRCALAESVGSAETLVTEPWRSPAYTRAFVEIAARLAEDPGTAQRAREAGWRHVMPERYSWDAIARSWEETFLRLFAERSTKRRADVLRRLLRDADVAAARRLVAGSPLPAEVFHAADLAELAERARAKPAELAEEPVWVDFSLDALPPQLAASHRALAAASGSGESATTLLDVGCHAANLTLLFARDRPWVRLTGVDGNPKALALARQKAEELGMGERSRFLCRVDPHLEEGGAELAPGGHDLVFLGEVLEFFPDPVALLEWAEARARIGVLGYTLHGPWGALTGDRFQLHHLGEAELRQMLGGKAGLTLEYFPCGETARGEPLGGWLFRYRVAPGNSRGALDLEPKIRRAPPLPRVSANVLVKNEEAHIRRCVESLLPIADEVLIGDTGATDLTVDILVSLGFRREPAEGGAAEGARRVIPVSFADFAQARNDLARHSRHCAADYILWQDADEILIEGRRLRRLLESNEYFDAFAIEQRHLLVDGALDSCHPLRCFRPVTLDGPLAWFGCIHEQVEHRLDEGPRKVLSCPGVFVAHLGYLHEQLRADKLFQRNWPLFLKDRREHPERLMGYLLGIREYLMLARHEIRQAGRMTEKAYRCLNYGFEIWHRHVRAMPAPFRGHGFGASREILELLAQQGRPLRQTGTVPIQADWSIEIAPGNAPRENGDRPRRWTYFADVAEMREEMERHLADLTARQPELQELLPLAPPIEVESAPGLYGLQLPPELFGLEPMG